MGKALLLCKAFPPVTGGVETYSEQIARAYLRMGIHVTVITQTVGRRGWQDRRYPEGRIPVYNTGSGRQLTTALKMCLSAYQITRRYSFDFYHATTWRPAMTLFAARRRTPTAVTVHGREVLRVPRLIRPAMRKVLRRADAVVAVSTATRARVTEHLGESVAVSKWIVAPNGLSHIVSDRDSVQSASRDRFTATPIRFLTLARFVERKNIQGCVAAFEALWNAGHRNFEYRIAGTGPLAAAIQGQIGTANLSENIELLGYVESEDIPDLYRWADVFLHPQIDLSDGEDFEGFGLSIADAMSFGCLAIAGGGSGPSEYIQHEKTGILVDGTKLKDIQAALTCAVTNPERYKLMAAAGQSYVAKELSWDKHARIVHTALSAKPNRHAPKY